MKKQCFDFVIVFLAFLIVGATGCGDDDNDWVGTWSVESIDGQSVAQILEELARGGDRIDFFTYEWIFGSDGTMGFEVSMQIETKVTGLDFSGGGSIIATGTYTLSGSNYTLTITNEEGTGIFREEKGFFGADSATGTWYREGNTLTLNSNEGGEMVLKKK